MRRVLSLHCDPGVENKLKSAGSSPTRLNFLDHGIYPGQLAVSERKIDKVRNLEPLQILWNYNRSWSCGMSSDVPYVASPEFLCQYTETCEKIN